MNRTELTEAFVSGEEVWSGGLLHVQRHVVRLPDGGTAVREFIRHPGAVLIAPLFDDGRVLLERQFRYPLAREFIELPAGKRHPGEDALLTAMRELKEETGYSARQWTRLGVIHNAIGYSDEGIELFVARDLALGERQLDEGEFLDVFSLPMAEALSMIADGRITDAKTVSALLWVQQFGA